MENKIFFVGSDLEGGRFFFYGVKEGDSLLYASDDKNECYLWVMAMYRATGQPPKPTPLVQPQTSKNSTISRLLGDADRTRKLGMDEFIVADPCKFDHHKLFRSLQTKTLDYRLNDSYCSLVGSVPGKFFALMSIALVIQFVAVIIICATSRLIELGRKICYDCPDSNSLWFCLCHMCMEIVLTGMEIQERWNHLRNSVVQELRGQTKNHSGDGARHRKKSLYFWSLLFLMSTGFASKQCQTFPMMKKRHEMMTHQKRQLPPRGKKGKQEMNTF